MFAVVTNYTQRFISLTPHALIFNQFGNLTSSNMLPPELIYHVYEHADHSTKYSIYEALGRPSYTTTIATVWHRNSIMTHLHLLLNLGYGAHRSGVMYRNVKIKAQDLSDITSICFSFCDTVTEPTSWRPGDDFDTADYIRELPHLYCPEHTTNVGLVLRTSLRNDPKTPLPERKICYEHGRPYCKVDGLKVTSRLMRLGADSFNVLWTSRSSWGIVPLYSESRTFEQLALIVLDLDKHFEYFKSRDRVRKSICSP